MYTAREEYHVEDPTRINVIVAAASSDGPSPTPTTESNGPRPGAAPVMFAQVTKAPPSSHTSQLIPCTEVRCGMDGSGGWNLALKSPEDSSEYDLYTPEGLLWLGYHSS